MPKKIINILLLFIFSLKIFGAGFADVKSVSKETSRLTLIKNSTEKKAIDNQIFFSETESEETDSDNDEADFAYYSAYIKLLFIDSYTTKNSFASLFSTYRQNSLHILFRNLRI